MDKYVDVLLFQFPAITTKTALNTQVQDSDKYSRLFLLSRNLAMEFPNCVVGMYLTCKELFSKVIVQLYVSTSSVRELHFLQILINTWYIHSFRFFAQVLGVAWYLIVIFHLHLPSD